MTTKRPDETKTPAAKPRPLRKKSTPKKAATKPARKTAAKPPTRKKAEGTPDSKPKATPTAKRAAVGRRQPTHQQIAARAREIWRERGGSAFENWIQAERDLKD